MAAEQAARQDRLGSAPLGRLIFQMAVPTVCAQLVQLLYNVVDRVYVGRIPGEGSLALAGLGVTFPVTILVAAFAMMVGIGGAARMAIAMGRKDQNMAEQLLGNSVTLVVIFSVMLTSVFWFTKDSILMAFGASEQTLPYASSYLAIYLLGTLFVQVSMGLNFFITNQGFAKTSMATTMIGCLLNIVLDPIFIFVFGMGVQGAALATILSQGVSAAWVFGFFFSKYSKLRLRAKNLRLSGKVVGAILSLGISAFIMQATECLIQLTFNRGMQTYGNDMYVALMSILFSLMQMVFLPIHGLGQGAQPIMSYNYGAGNMERVKRTANLLIRICLVFTLIAVGIVELFPGVFLRIFTPDMALLELGKTPLRIYMFGMLVFGIQSACQQVFLALGQTKCSMFLALLRKVILLVPLALILPHIGGLGVWGLFWAEPLSDLLSVTTTAVLYLYHSKTMFAQPQQG